MYLAFERYRKEEKHNKYFYILIYIYNSGNFLLKIYGFKKF